MTYTLTGVTLADGTTTNVVVEGQTISSVGALTVGELIDCSKYELP